MLRGTKYPAQRLQEELAQDGVDHAEEDGERHCVAHAGRGLVGLALADIQTHKGSAAVADHQAHGQHDGHNGKDDVRGGVAQIADTVSDEDLVDHVVQGVHHQRNDAGNSKPDQKFTDRLRSQRI